jgi:hypothetical protein
VFSEEESTSANPHAAHAAHPAHPASHPAHPAHLALELPMHATSANPHAAHPAHPASHPAHPAHPAHLLRKRWCIPTRPLPPGFSKLTLCTRVAAICLRRKFAAVRLEWAGVIKPTHSRSSTPCRSKSHRTPRVFVTTRTCFDTMARRRQDADEDEITEADDTAGAATFGGSSTRGSRQVTSPSMSGDPAQLLPCPPHSAQRAAIYFCLVLSKTTAAASRGDPKHQHVRCPARLAARPAHALGGPLDEQKAKRFQESWNLRSPSPVQNRLYRQYKSLYRLVPSANPVYSP